jgi:hypothetical protein
MLSISASGQFAKTLVYFTWKGLNVARQHVVPTNPKTTAQNTQRGYVQDAVAGIHTAMADATYPIDDEDKSAYSLLGSLQSTPRTWFNTIVKTVVDQLVASKYWAIFSAGHCTPADTQLTVEMHVTASVGGDPTDGKLYYGTSKSAMLNNIACTVADLATGKAITSLTNGVKYYVQYRPSTAAEYIGCNSGIYVGTPAA